MKRFPLAFAIIGLFAASVAANAQMMGGYGVSGSAGAAAGSAGAATVVNPTIVSLPPDLPPSGDEGFLQINNLVVQSVSSQSVPAEIVAANNYPIPMMEGNTGGGTGVGVGRMMNQSSPTPTPAPPPASVPTSQSYLKCFKFQSADDARSVPVNCPTPSVVATGTTSAGASAASGALTAPGMARPMMYPYPGYGSYRIKVDASTRLFLRDRSTASLADFTAGDQINVFGFYNTDGSVQAYLVRDLSKPTQKEFFQLNNAQVVSVSGTAAPATLVVVQQPNFPCYNYGATGEGKPSIACPMGAQSASGNTMMQNLQAPTSLMPIWNMLRKYVVAVDAQTIILDRTRTQLSLGSIKIGDQLNIYGATSDNGQTIDADIVRDISQPPAATVFNGTISQVNADGSFVVKTNDGQAITVPSPLKVGMNVQLKGILDAASGIISQLSGLTIGDVSDGTVGVSPAGPLPYLRVQGTPALPPNANGTPNTQN